MPITIRQETEYAVNSTTFSDITIISLLQNFIVIPPKVNIYKR